MSIKITPSPYTFLIIESLKGKKIDSILELGCGDGHNLWIVGSSIGATIAGCDKDQKQEIEGVEFPFKVRNLLNQLDYADKSFDLVMLPGVLYQIEDYTLAIQEAIRIAKKYVLICDFRKEVNGVRWRDYKPLLGQRIEEYPEIVTPQGIYILIAYV